MKTIFCKIFEIEKGQVLLIKDYDCESNLFGLNQITNIQGSEISAKSAFKDETLRDKAFDDFDKTKAEKFYSTILNQLF